MYRDAWVRNQVSLSVFGLTALWREILGESLYEVVGSLLLLYHDGQSVPYHKAGSERGIGGAWISFPGVSRLSSRTVTELVR